MTRESIQRTDEAGLFPPLSAAIGMAIVLTLFLSTFYLGIKFLIG